MQNHGLEMYSDEILEDSITQNTLNYLKTYSTNLSNRPNI
jgi:hypothetical protein